MRWDLTVIVLAVWNCFFIPLDIAFNPSLSNEAYFLVIDSLIDIFFACDIVVNFRTTFVNKYGEEVTDTKKIARKYIFGGRFIIDFLAVVPVKYIKIVSEMELR